MVRGDPELRFHQGSTRGSTGVPPGFHQGSTRVPPNFHQGCSRVPPGFYHVLQGRGVLGKVPRGFHQGSTNFFECGFEEGFTRVPQAAGWSGWFEVRLHEVPPGLQGGPGWFEVRLHEGSTRVPPARRAPDEGSTRVPPISSRARRAGEGSTRVPQQGSTSGPGWFEVMFHENSTRLCKVRFHSSTVLAGFHEVLRGLRGRPGWFEVRLYEGFRVPQDSARAVGPEVSQGSTKLCKDSTWVPRGSTMLHQGCVVRPSSEKPSDQDRFAHGRNTKQNRNQWFLEKFTGL